MERGIYALPNMRLFSGRKKIISKQRRCIGDSRVFRDRRCVIPAKGFYEWNSAKEKFAFESTEDPVLFLAGCFNWFESERNPSAVRTTGTAGNQREERFVILTTEARGRAAQIHERMPLLLRTDEIRIWLFDDEKTDRFLHREPEEMLECKTDYEQLSLF